MHYWSSAARNTTSHGRVYLVQRASSELLALQIVTLE
jgi:hypothetical protein